MQPLSCGAPGSGDKRPIAFVALQFLEALLRGNTPIRTNVPLNRAPVCGATKYARGKAPLDRAATGIGTFVIQNGLKQAHALLPLFFTFALEYANKLVYADDTNSLAKTRTLQRNTRKLY
jgi:hypothetical protein